MSEDVLKRAQQALANVGRTTPTTNSNDLIARARAAVAGQPVAPPPVRPAVQQAPPIQQTPAPRAERVRVEMTCGATGRAFIVIAERHGAQLILVENEAPQRGGSGGNAAAPTEYLSGTYNIGNSPGWACPLCRTSTPGWICNCPARPGALHCNGSHNRKRYCACGRFEDRHLTSGAPAVQVRGQSTGSTTASSAPPRSSGLPTIRGR